MWFRGSYTKPPSVSPGPSRHVLLLPLDIAWSGKVWQSQLHTVTSSVPGMWAVSRQEVFYSPSRSELLAWRVSQNLVSGDGRVGGWLAGVTNEHTLTQESDYFLGEGAHQLLQLLPGSARPCSLGSTQLNLISSKC